MEPILISACLIGKRVRYDGKALSVAEEILQQWIAEGRLVSVCPEVDAGMSIPRAPAEIVQGSGADVLQGKASVVDNLGIDVTDYFKNGAQLALNACRNNNIKIAVLTESSPSCGSSTIYDGRFSKTKIRGEGVTAALLKANGVKVFSQYQISAAMLTLKSI